MAKRVFIIHGWEGFPEEGWFPWLKSELEAKGFEVFVPQLPESSNPRILNWVPAVAAAVTARLDELIVDGFIDEPDKAYILSLGNNKQSRAQEIGLGDIGEGHVRNARALP